MADNVVFKDGAGADFTAAADEVGGVKYQRAKSVWGPDDTVFDTSGTAPMPVQAYGVLVNPSSNFTRPGNTTPYALSGDLVANSTTAASVVALSWAAARIAAGNFFVRGARLKKSGTSITSAEFRLHLYNSDPAAASGITNGDNGVWLTKHAGYLGWIDIVVDKAFSDAAGGVGAPALRSEIMVALASGQTIYGLLEARAAYTPANAEVFTVDLEVVQN